MRCRYYALATALILCAAPLAAQGHALLERSEPGAGVVIAAERAPSSISLSFTEPVGVGASAVAVFDAQNRRVDRANAHRMPSEPNRIQVDLAPELPQGAYLVRWRVTSADDHVVRGSYWFAVGFAATPPPAAELLGSAPLRVSYLELVARWLGLFALLVMAGAPLFHLAVLRQPALRGPAFMVVLFLAAHVLLAAAQTQSAGELPLVDRFALLWWLRLALALVLGWLLYRGQQKLAAAVALLLLIATSLASHAVAGGWLVVAIDTVHLAAASLWLGGLFELARLWRSLPDLRTLVPRVSIVFLPTVVILIATGFYNAWQQVGSFDALRATAHGQSLMVKLALLVPLLAIAAVNLLIVRPRISRVQRLFLRNVRAETTLIFLLLFAVALLGALPPAAQQPLPAQLEMARQAGELRVGLRVDPAWVGVSRFEVSLGDDRGLPPSDVRKVVLTFTMEGMNMGRTNVTMNARGEGRFETEGFYIGMPGVSQIGVAVDRGGAQDRSAIFRMEVPDLNPQQVAGLKATLFPPKGIATVNPETGRQLYKEHCAACHGETGVGDGAAARSLLPPPADLTLHARWHADEQLDWFIRHGVPGTSMIGFGDRLGPAQRHAVIGHLHALASAPTASALRTSPVTPSQISSSNPAAGLSLDGRLVFGPDFDNNLWLLSLPDGKPQPLTQLGPKEFSSNPAWSPDGRSIAFSYYRLPEQGPIPVPDGTDLYLMSADGSAMRALALHEASGAALQHPAWAADGTAVYISHAGPGGERSIERISVATGKRSRVAPNAAYPALSRDGRALAYVRYATPPDRGESLWLGAPDDSRARQVVAPSVFAKYFGLRFSPDSQRLVFAAVGQPARPLSFFIGAAHANGDLWDLWVVDVDGRNLRPLTALGEDMPIAAWSPDGTQIAFLGGGSAASAEAGVTVVPAQGKDLRRLTTQPGHRGLDWTAR